MGTKKSAKALTGAGSRGPKKLHERPTPPYNISGVCLRIEDMPIKFLASLRCGLPRKPAYAAVDLCGAKG